MSIERIIEVEGMSPEGLALIHRRFSKKVSEAETLLTSKMAESYDNYQQRFISLKTWREALSFVEQLQRELQEDYDNG